MISTFCCIVVLLSYNIPISESEAERMYYRNKRNPDKVKFFNIIWISILVLSILLLVLFPTEDAFNRIFEAYNE